MTRDLNEVVLIEHRLKEKKWDATAMIEYLRRETGLQTTAADALKTKWAEAVTLTKSSEDTTATQQLREVAGKIDEMTKLTEKHFNEYKKSTLVEVGKHK